MSLETIKESKGKLVGLINELVNLTEKEIENLSSKIEDLEIKVEELEEELKIKVPFNYPKGFNANIVVVGVLEDLFENLNRIPVSEIEALVNKYKF